MIVILTGGGSGGHITPVIAVAAELKKRDPRITTVYFGQKGDKFASIVGDNEFVDKLILVRAGKFRRFHGEGLKQIFDLPVLYKNIRDIFYVFIGLIQSFIAIRKLKPQVVFSRGGYVSVPVALGAKLNGVPYITHDSDPIPSLANRLIAPWASVHAVALPKEIYPYPMSKTITTGIPLNKKFVSINSKIKESYRKKIGVPLNSKILFVIGGGLGSQAINEVIVDSAANLLAEFNNLYIFHVAGAINEADLKKSYEAKLTEEEQGRVRVFGFTNDVYLYSGAADVVITRAGATNLAEFAVQGKACIVIPSSFLTGGHQVKSANYLEKNESAIVLNEDKILNLPKIISDLFRDKNYRERLETNFNKQAITNATEIITDIVLDVGNKNELKI